MTEPTDNSGITRTHLVFNIATSCVGIGIITFHHTFAKCGLALSLLLSIIYACMCSEACKLLVQSSLKCQVKTMGEMVHKLFGVNQFIVFNMLMLFGIFCVCVSYSIHFSILLTTFKNNNLYSLHICTLRPNGSQRVSIFCQTNHTNFFR